MPPLASPSYVMKLKSREVVAEQTIAFRFERPVAFAFTPGQYVDMTLLNFLETDAEGHARTFSIASAPFEDFIIVTTCLRDTAYKQVVRTLPVGTEVKMEGPSAT